MINKLLFVPYSFKEDAPVAQRPAAQKIHLEFWTKDPGYAIDWIAKAAKGGLAINR